MTPFITYKLAHYKILEDQGGGFWWESHADLGGAKGGKCFIDGNFLIIGPPEMENPGFLKREFLEHLSKLPKWDKTEFYCLSQSIYSCRTGGRISVRDKHEPHLVSSPKNMLPIEKLNNQKEEIHPLQDDDFSNIKKSIAGVYHYLKNWINRH